MSSLPNTIGCLDGKDVFNIEKGLKYRGAEVE